VENRFFLISYKQYNCDYPQAVYKHPIIPQIW